MRTFVADPGLIRVYPLTWPDRTELCIRCRDQGVIAPADLAIPYTCRGHAAEDRVNDLLGYTGRR